MAPQMASKSLTRACLRCCNACSRSSKAALIWARASALRSCSCWLMPPTKAIAADSCGSLGRGKISYWGGLRCPHQTKPFLLPAAALQEIALPDAFLPSLRILSLHSPGSLTCPCRDTIPDGPTSPGFHQVPTGRAQPPAGAAGLPYAAPPRHAAAPCRAPGAPPPDTRHTWPSHRPHSKTPSSGSIKTSVRQWLDTKLLCPFPCALLAPYLPGAPPTWTYPEKHPLTPSAPPSPPDPPPQVLASLGLLGPTLPSWLGQERGRPATALRGWGSSGSWAPSGACCIASIRLLMKKLFCSAETPCSGRIDVCRHTGQDSVRLWAGM